jgi:lipopolysaccharide export system permease protein
MKLIERYIFARLTRVFLLSLLTLCATVWLTQALGQVSLMTVQGQTIGLFLQITFFVLPEVTALITPVAVLIAVTNTFTTLNNDSELVVINASGAPQSALLKPVLLLGLAAATFIAIMTLYLGPISQRSWRTEITAVRTNVLTSILREGNFMKIAEGVTFNLRNRRPDGTLQGLFVSDTRDPESTVTYLAEDGSVLESPIGTFIIMREGSIQRRSKADGSISMIEFSSYAFDLTTFASQSGTPQYMPGEQSTAYLLRPDPGDRTYQKSPGQFAIELHRRLVAPLYALVFALVPLVFIAQAESTRGRRGLALTVGITIAVIIRILGGILNATTDTTIGAVIGYAVPLGMSVLAAVLVLTGVRPHMPDRVSDIADDTVERIRRLFRRSAVADRPGW